MLPFLMPHCRLSAGNEPVPFGQPDNRPEPGEPRKFCLPQEQDGIPPIADLHELEGFTGKGGKGGKSAEESGKHEEPPLLADIGVLEEFPKKSDKKRSRQVDV